MDPLVSKIIAGTLVSTGIGAPGIYFTIDYLNPRTIQEQLDKDKLQMIGSSSTEKWTKKIDNKKSDEDLKNFIKEHRNPVDEVNATKLEEACKAALNKRTNEASYEKFKEYCVE